MLELNKIYCGDARELLKQLDSESIDCMITSPPYWGLRDYGLEPVIWDAVDGCEHEWGNKIIRKGIVLDIFGGAGTVGVSAIKYDRNFILFELNPEYIKMANKRIEQERMQMKLEFT